MRRLELSIDEVEKLLPGYVLGSLESDEMLAVDAFLSTRTELDDKLLELEETMVLLAVSSPDVPLSPAVKSNLFSKIEADIAAETVARPASTQAKVIQPAAADKGESFLDWIRSLFSSPGPYAVMATGAFALALIAGLYALNLNSNLQDVEASLASIEEENVTLSDENAQLASDLATAQNENSQLASDLTSVETTNATLQDELMGLQAEYQELRFNEEQLQVVSYATNSVDMEAHEEFPGIRGFFYFGTQQEPGLLVLHGLEKLPDDQVYQFWLVTPDGKQVPHELLLVDGPQAPTLKTITLDDETPDFVAIGITIEPAGGSPNPTGVMLLQAADVLNG